MTAPFGPVTIDRLEALLCQTDLWVDLQGREHRFTEMSTAYLGNVVMHLRENCAYLRRATMVAQDLALTVAWCLVPLPNGQALDAVGAPEIAEAEAIEWVEALPLMAALLAELERREAW